MARFSGKVVAITGGGSGLGRECALQWSEEGGKIVVTDIVEERALKVAAEITDKGGAALGVVADVSVEGDMENAVNTATKHFGQLDIMFANAGITQAGWGRISLEDLTESQWDEVVNVVYKGVWLAAKHACRQMKRQGRGGNIVVTTSAGGLNSYPGYGAYCSGKAGAIGLIKSMAHEWGRYGIRVNGLAPTHGMSVNFALPPDAPVIGLSYEDYAVQESGKEWDAKVMFPGPLKVSRPPSLRDNAAVATFLASDDSMYISGLTIPSCDGGNFAITSIPIPDDFDLSSKGDL